MAFSQLNSLKQLFMYKTEIRHTFEPACLGALIKFVHCVPSPFYDPPTLIIKKMLPL